MTEPVDDDTGLDDDVAELASAVLTASRVLVGVSAMSLAAAEERMTLAQFRVLGMLANHGEIKLVTLADRLAVNPSAATRMVDRLVDGGYVSRQVNPDGRQEVLLRLTKAGRRIVDEGTTRRRRKSQPSSPGCPPGTGSGWCGRFVRSRPPGVSSQLRNASATWRLSTGTDAEQPVSGLYNICLEKFLY